MPELLPYVQHDPARTEPLALTLDDIVRALAHLAGLADDPEAMHGYEDDLHRLVLRAVAVGHPQAQELAAAALRTDDIDAPRWTA